MSFYTKHKEAVNQIVGGAFVILVGFNAVGVFNFSWWWVWSPFVVALACGWLVGGKLR